MSRALAGRKYPTIDIVALYAKGDTKGWNALLTKAYKRHDVEGLKKLLYGIQAGMADADDTSDNKIREWFLRIQRSIENTAKKIYREKYPNPLDNPLNKDIAEFQRAIEVKRKRDNAFESFLREASF